MAVKKQDYIVLKKGVSAELGGREYKVGETIKLTEQQAAARVNKVQLKSDMAVAPGADKALEAVTKELDELKETHAATVTALGEMTKERDELVKAQVK